MIDFANAPPKDEGMTQAQAAILDKLASIEAELACMIRETRRTIDSIRRARGEHDRQSR